MALKTGTYTIGPADGTVLVRTGRDGAAARMGHDLTLEAERWNAKVVVDAAHPARSKVTATVDARSLSVRDARGGALPLIDRQREEIADNIRNKVLNTSRHPRITFASTAVAGEGARVTLTGDLTIVGTTRPMTLRLVTRRGAGHVTGRATVVQSDYGINQYSTMLGQLRVADAVEIEVDVKLPAAPSTPR
jgi:polyisoprenoid-binding protein YceI